MTFFRKKFHFYAQNKFLMTIFTLFLTKNLDFRTKDFSLRPFFSQFVLCLTSNNSTSQNIGGTDGPFSHLKLVGGPSPQPPKSPPMSCIATCLSAISNQHSSC